MTQDYETQVMGVIVTSARLNLLLDHTIGAAAVLMLAYIGFTSYNAGEMGFLTLLAMAGFAGVAYMKANAAVASKYYLNASRLVYKEMLDGSPVNKAFKAIPNEHMRERVKTLYDKIIRTEE